MWFVVAWTEENGSVSSVSDKAFLGNEAQSLKISDKSRVLLKESNGTNLYDVEILGIYGTGIIIFKSLSASQLFLSGFFSEILTY